MDADHNDNPELPDLSDLTNVTKVEHEGRTYYLVGTAHVSKHSVEEVKEVIERVKPDTVAIELCKARYQALNDTDRWKNLDIFKVIKEGKTLFLLANLAIGAYQRRLGAELGVQPGAEMMAAAEAADALGAKLALVDRDIHVTLKRTWANIGFFDKMKLVGAIMESLVAKQEIDEEMIESLKEDDKLADMMSEFAKAFPQVKRPLIDERDEFMVHKLRDTRGEVVVAVVGAGHVPGMVANFDEDIDIDEISRIPPPSPWLKAAKWVIPAIVIGAFYFGLQGNSDKSWQELVYAWVIPNAVAAAVLTAIGGGKIGSIAAAFVGSPITSLNPLINTGLVVGFTEAWLRKPTVEDAERINDDIQTFKGFYNNQFTRVLIVAFMAMIGSALGAWIGMSWILGKVAT